MALPDAYKWEAFKKATNIKGASRGKSMEYVDQALKSYWEGITVSTALVELANLVAVITAVNSWLKSKKKKKAADQAGTKGAKDHFVKRWNTLVLLGKECFKEAKRLAGAGLHAPSTLAKIQYEQRKMKTNAAANPRQRILRGLQGAYAAERTLFVGQGKQSNPVSGTEVHNVHGDADTSKRMREWSQKPEYADLFAKDFSQLTPADFLRFEGMMTAMQQASTQNLRFKHHVCFLRKQDRLLHMVLVDDNGRLSTSDGRPADTGGGPWLYAMDEYANLFILEPDKFKASGLRTNHSSLLAGKDVICAGELEIKNGVLTYIGNTSGHYLPGQNNLYLALLELQDQGVPLNQTQCDILESQTTGWRDIPAQDILNAQGNVSKSHKSYGSGKKGF
jgi:hypothetical protein